MGPLGASVEERGREEGGGGVQLREKNEYSRDKKKRVSKSLERLWEVRRHIVPLSSHFFSPHSLPLLTLSSSLLFFLSPSLSLPLSLLFSSVHELC